MRAAVQTVAGSYEVDLETGEVSPASLDAPLPRAVPPRLDLPRVRAAAASGSTVVAAVDARPPLLISHDAGRTWREAGAGLPRGDAVAIDDDNPDLVVYASRNRLHVSEDGGRFWRSLTAELPQIRAVGFV